jgi:hypothetical protein
MKAIDCEHVKWSDLANGRDFYAGAEELSSTEGAHWHNE